MPGEGGRGLSYRIYAACETRRSDDVADRGDAQAAFARYGMASALLASRVRGVAESMKRGLCVAVETQRARRSKCDKQEMKESGV